MVLGYPAFLWGAVIYYEYEFSSGFQEIDQNRTLWWVQYLFRGSHTLWRVSDYIFYESFVQLAVVAWTAWSNFSRVERSVHLFLGLRDKWYSCRNCQYNAIFSFFCPILTGVFMEIGGWSEIAMNCPIFQQHRTIVP